VSEICQRARVWHGRSSIGPFERWTRAHGSGQVKLNINSRQIPSITQDQPSFVVSPSPPPPSGPSHCLIPSDTICPEGMVGPCSAALNLSDREVAMHASHEAITCSSHLPTWDLSTRPLLRHAVRMRPKGLAAAELRD
jgi:hypothetical protein